VIALDFCLGIGETDAKDLELYYEEAAVDGSSVDVGTETPLPVDSYHHQPYSPAVMHNFYSVLVPWNSLSHRDSYLCDLQKLVLGYHH